MLHLSRSDKAGLAVVSSELDFRLTFISLAAALPILLGSYKRFHILRHIDWHALVFFAAMFILMESIWNSGYFQNLLQRMEFPIASTTAILIVGSVLGQFMSNVPLAALYLPMLSEAGVSAKELMALNVIVIQNAEKKSRQTITFGSLPGLGFC